MHNNSQHYDHSGSPCRATLRANVSDTRKSSQNLNSLFICVYFFCLNCVLWCNLAFAASECCQKFSFHHVNVFATVPIQLNLLVFCFSVVCKRQYRHDVGIPQGVVFTVTTYLTFLSFHYLLVKSESDL